MKNSDMPAMPFDQLSENEIDQGYKKEHTGLTKREYFAGLAMQGFIADGGMPENMISESSLIMADALLKELDK